MPRLLPHGALDAPSLAPRWITLAVLTALAAPFAISAAHDAAPASLNQETTRFIWDADDISAAEGTADGELAAHFTAPETLTGARFSAGVDGRPFTVESVWEPGVTITEIRIERYTDLHGNGLRLGLSARADTHTGAHCMAVAVTGLDTDLGDTSLHTCTRTDAQPQSDTYAGGDNTDQWEPEHLFITQTAQVTPAAKTGEHLVDYFGIGAGTGNAHQTGLWGPNWWRPMGHGPHYEQWRRSCDDPGPALDAPPLAHTDPPPLPIPACVPITDTISADPESRFRFSTSPFTTTAATPLSGWARYNDVSGRSQPLRMAVTIDLRSCDTAIDRCHTGTGAEWMTALLEPPAAR